MPTSFNTSPRWFTRCRYQLKKSSSLALSAGRIHTSFKNVTLIFPFQAVLPHHCQDGSAQQHGAQVPLWGAGLCLQICNQVGLVFAISPGVLFLSFSFYDYISIKEDLFLVNIIGMKENPQCLPGEQKHGSAGSAAFNHIELWQPLLTDGPACSKRLTAKFAWPIQGLFNPYFF